jgi:cytochrome c551/c552
MKKIDIGLIWVFCILAMNHVAAADEGENIFKSQGCTACHKIQSTSKVNPSLTEISMAYQGRVQQLIKYLKGESDAIVRPEKANLMRRYIEKTKYLSDADRQALAVYILSQQ